MSTELIEAKMVEVAEAEAELARINSEVYGPQRELVTRLKNEYARLICPHKVGDVMVSGDGTNQKARVVDIVANYRSYELVGTIITQDGRDGRTQRLHSYRNWVPKKYEDIK